MSETKADEHKRMSGWWALISAAVGIAVAIAFGQSFSDGGAEIAGVMAGSSVLCTRAFWDFRVKRWFLPLVVGWICIHATALVFLILPMELHGSKGLISFVWVEFFAFAGIIFLASRLWGGLRETAESDA